ncbi:hypothetical protein ENBRE01_1545 [Enteropsectra breve]|nr:hypothetical protein ENBRE01_1545 [Enteropsectra breve]
MKSDVVSKKMIISILSAAASSFLMGCCMMSSDQIMLLVEQMDLLKNNDSNRKKLDMLLFAGGFLSNIFITQFGPSNRNMLIISDALYFLSFSALLVPQMAAKYLGRVLMGMGNGYVASSVPRYLSTIAPLSHKGIITTMHVVFLTFGIVAAAVANWCQVLPLYCFVALMGFCLLNLFLRRFRIGLNETLVGIRSSFISLLTNRAALRSLAIILFAHTAQSLSGNNHVTFSARSLFSGADTNLNLILIYWNVAATAITIAQSFVIDRLGRKLLFLLSSFVVAICCISFYFRYSVRAFAVLYVIGFNIGLNAVPHVLVGEVFPPEHALNGSVYAISCNWLSGLLGIAIQDTNTVENNKSWIYYIAALAVCGVAVVHLYKETKGKQPKFQ